MIPPRGFSEPKHPLRHKMYYAASLSPITGTLNTCSFQVLRHYVTSIDPDTIIVNPKRTDYDEETGSVVNKDSIIDRLRIKLNFSLTKNGIDTGSPFKCWWQPIFFSFPEKLDAADKDTGTTVATILQLIKDATKEDVTPLFNNVKHSILGASDRLHPVSTVNSTETFTTLNMDTDLKSEGITWDDALLQNAMIRYTNKGALKACLGRRRFFTLSLNKLHHSEFINKRPPRAVRRIMPYSYMAIVCHVPLVTGDDQYYFAQDLTATIGYVGVTCKIRYHEWNNLHNQDSE